MSLILHIETATQVCSAALSRDGLLMEEVVAETEMAHASTLMPMIDALLKQNNVVPADLSAVSVSSGPGSYTGLRIGVSTGKGICHSLGIPLIAVGSLHSAAFGMKEISKATGTDLLIPLIDARRMEAFAAFYDASLNEVRPSTPWIMDESSLDEFADRKVFLAGTGAEKLKALYSTFSNVVFLNENMHRAAFACSLAFEKFQKLDFENTAYFEPNYGKDFIPGKPVIKGLK
ncbi:MAG: tRNA (adenosine(37)-N6)-threonylcarbamoyltransferase complex dimerization subunit type 1 TsaB [Bacteroidetes bacterium GWF2_43_63]|nr:MAG: tRNA (adenosine(37)-N6)-threonylcarbamoyltransferase complex dimerization subunit type 1 TsaB [Bacteroidetes bacterium GWE2_42_42]OFY55551.1 MAG: tRNA (adenosine(37)-N6)-threonylcarbamoyltransferase complex dimerization subunit type 1 TsaB [Bacteroidetes bacterium GWF2_43_63]HBG71563.1 tRNA (adenosine(37)-N6)-threonylcarbamoyltransferase complex dimerization subunit type 1 TsaB [Bacteroidales bacterium]HCB62096.1 tRNA (adenosine(37)-N6)-threonylcarbamoyltransferase complex dimerization s